MTCIVHVCKESQTGRYYVDSSDILGLHVEADTFEEFVAIVKDVAPDLLGEATPGSEINFQQSFQKYDDGPYRQWHLTDAGLPKRF